jgi:hypothetical protein
MERKKNETALFHQSVATLYATRNVDDPDERSQMLSTGAPCWLCVLAPPSPRRSGTHSRMLRVRAQQCRTSTRQAALTSSSALILISSEVSAIGCAGSRWVDCSCLPRRPLAFSLHRCARRWRSGSAGVEALAVFEWI